ncbi:hypothetical protein EYR40_001466 [Pleurotus pulmonarius]|nr:hypothetical protein EYR38_004705 [Pleurotus pulmonarius]KAF4609113.1 hypothetical protein EYR40_001466 [Pleurotus pulmonarius]
MKFTSALCYVALFVVPLATAVTVSFDEIYGDPRGSLSSVACSDGDHGIIPLLKVESFGQLPNFPFIGGAAAISSWNSPQCGTCWELSYNGRTINILAIDHADDGFNISLPAMNELTNGQAVELGRVDAAVRQVDSSVCGL